MSLYTYSGSPKAFTIGRPLLQFSIENVSLENKKIIATGILIFGNIVTDFKSPRHPPVSLFWHAENLCQGKEWLGWNVSQQPGKEQNLSPILADALSNFVRVEIERFVIENPKILGKHTFPEPVPSNVLQLEAEKFPQDWAHKYRPALAATKNPVQTPRVPADPRKPYKGPCVCEDLDMSGPRQPFDWQGKTEGTDPKRCFECSCGAMWWCNRPAEHFWVQVYDLRAWSILSNNNGVPVATLAYEGNRVYLAESLMARPSGLAFYIHKE